MVKCRLTKTLLMSLKIQLIVILSVFTLAGNAYAQPSSEDLSPTGAMLRSLVVPGWGQYYTDQSNWSRGKIHLLTDVALLSSYFGIQINASRLEVNRNTFALKHAGIDLASHSRSVRLYVSDFNSVEEFNDFQERARNWNMLIQPSDGIQWQWDSEQRRNQFTALNSRIDQQRQQLPAILTLMLVNRVIAGVHAYTQAMERIDHDISLFISPAGNNATGGYQATLRIGF